jgi:negative regulator of flagellin synthesis FlgM
MKIDDKMINYEINKYLPKSGPSGSEKIDEQQVLDQQRLQRSARPEQDAVVNLSQASKEAQKIEEVISSEPEIREDKVAALKEKIESGTYKVDHKAVAEKMVDSFVDELS